MQQDRLENVGKICTKLGVRLKRKRPAIQRFSTSKDSRGHILFFLMKMLSQSRTPSPHLSSLPDINPSDFVCVVDVSQGYPGWLCLCLFVIKCMFCKYMLAFLFVCNCMSWFCVCLYLIVCVGVYGYVVYILLITYFIRVCVFVCVYIMKICACVVELLNAQLLNAYTI